MQQIQVYSQGKFGIIIPYNNMVGKYVYYLWNMINKSCYLKKHNKYKYV